MKRKKSPAATKIPRSSAAVRQERHADAPIPALSWVLGNKGFFFVSLPQGTEYSIFVPSGATGGTRARASVASTNFFFLTHGPSLRWM